MGQIRTKYQSGTQLFSVIGQEIKHFGFEGQRSFFFFVGPIKIKTPRVPQYLNGVRFLLDFVA